MNHYPHHLGDYAEATGHLTFIEDAAYSRCIRKYYSTEKPLPADIKSVQRLVGARTKEELAAVETVLNEFFYLRDDGWHNQRCDYELAIYFEKSSKASASANARWKASSSNANAMRTHKKEDANALRTHMHTQCEGNANQEPRTKNHISLSDDKDKRARAAPVLKPVEVSENIWADFVQHRKTKKAVITQTAINGIKSEADKAGIGLEAALVMCLNRGWTGFKADWVTQKNSTVASGALSFKEKDELKARDTYESITGKVHPKNAQKRGVIIESIGGQNEFAIAVG